MYQPLCMYITSLIVKIEMYVKYYLHIKVHVYYLTLYYKIVVP